MSPSIALLRTQSDERLLALAAEGSEPAFTALVERYRRLVLRACMRVLPEARAEDATQQVFLAAWKALTRGDQVRNVRPWLLRIARNTALNALRAPGFEYDELAASLEGHSAPQDELEKRDVMRQTLQGLAALPENQREALLRSAVQGTSHADIARDLGISEGATRNLVLRARATLRSAATAVTPLPLLNWAASGPSAGIAEVAAGGTAIGTTALLAKAGAVVVIAGGAAATPAIVHEVRGDSAEPAKAAERPARQDERPAGPQSAQAEAEDNATRPATAGSAGGDADDRPASQRRRDRGINHRGSGPGGSGPGDVENEQPGSGSPGPGGGNGGNSGNSGNGNSGPGGGHSGDDDNSGHDDQNDEASEDNSGPGSSGQGNGNSNSGPGSGDDDDEETADELVPTPTATPDDVEAEEDPDEDNSGPGGGTDADEQSGD